MATLCANINKDLGGYGTNATSLSDPINIVNSHGSTKTVTLFIRYKPGAHAQFTPVVARATDDTFIWIHQNGTPDVGAVGVPAALGKFDVNHNVGSTIYYSPNHHQAGSDGWVRVDRTGAGMAAGGIVTVVAEFAVASGTTSIKVGAVLNHNGDYNYSGTNQHELIDITNCDGMMDVMGSSSYTFTVNRSVIDNPAGGRNGDRMKFTATAPGTLTWDVGDGTNYTTTGTHEVTHIYENQSTTPGSQINVTASSGGVEQIYNTPGTHTYTVPTGVTKLLVLCTGGGGGGGGGYDNGGKGGPGGGAGGHVLKSVTVAGGEKYTIVVGGGGAKGTGGTGNKGGGSDGSASRFYKEGDSTTSLIWANGGKGGTDWSSGGYGGTASTGGITGEAGGPGYYDGGISRNGGGGDVMINQTFAGSVGLTLKNAGGCSGSGSYGGNKGYGSSGGTCNWSGTNHAGNQAGIYGGGGAGGTTSAGSGGGGVVAIFVGGGSGSASFDFNYITMVRPDQNEVVTVIPYNAEALTAVNQQLNSGRPLSWYLTSRDNGFGSAAVIGTGYVPSISQYANGSTKLSIADGAYDVMVKDTGANIWAQHQIQIGASPTVVITNVVDDDVITSDKQVQGEATNATGGSINSSIVWDLYRMDTSTSIQTATGETFTPIPNVIGAKYDIRAKITSNSQTVTAWKRRIQINAAVVPNADIDTDTLILLPTEKNTGRVLYGGSWNSLFDDAGSGKRRAYRSAVGGGIITGSNEVRLGLAEQSSSSSIYNSNVKNIDSVKKVYDYYRDYIYSHAGDGQTWDGTTIPAHMKRHSSQTSKSFSMAECVKATLASFYVKVKNDTSGTLYSTDGNGTIHVFVNMGTGAFDVTINGNKKTGVTNNSSHSVGGIEGGSAIQCAVVAKYSSTEVTKSTFKVTMGRSNGSWSCVYKGTTFSGSNNIPMFFYSGSEPPGNNENANYGSPV